MRQVRGNVVGMVFQDPMSSLNPTMTIGDQIAESVLLHRDVGRKAALDRAVEVLGLVGMPKPAERVGRPHAAGRLTLTAACAEGPNWPASARPRHCGQAGLPR